MAKISAGPTYERSSFACLNCFSSLETPNIPDKKVTLTVQFAKL